MLRVSYFLRQSRTVRTLLEISDVWKFKKWIIYTLKMLTRNLVVFEPFSINMKVWKLPEHLLGAATFSNFLHLFSGTCSIIGQNSALWWLRTVNYKCLVKSANVRDNFQNPTKFKNSRNVLDFAHQVTIPALGNVFDYLL